MNLQTLLIGASCAFLMATSNANAEEQINLTDWPFFQFLGEYFGETVTMYAFWAFCTASLLYFVAIVISLISKFWPRGDREPFLGEYFGETVTMYAFKMYAFWAFCTASLLYFVAIVISLILKFWSRGDREL